MKRWAVVLDFDGTVTLRDVADSILLRYASLGAEDIADPHDITEAQVRHAFLRVKAPERELQRFARDTASMRHGFDRMMHGFRERGVPVEIVSGGFDVYLDHLLEHWGLGWVPRYRGAAKASRRGLDVNYRFLAGTTLDAFKKSRVQWYRRRGYRVLFAGDGASDFGAARAADLAFARDRLLRLCRKGGVSARTLTTFHHAAAAVRRGR